jgi:hypothetical protein
VKALSQTLALVAFAACSGSAPPTDKWCRDYAGDLNQTLRPVIAQLADGKPLVRHNAADQLRLSLDVPEQKLAATVCGKPAAKVAAARDAFVHAMLTDLGNLDTTQVSEADVADLQAKFDAITQALMK